MLPSYRTPLLISWRKDALVGPCNKITTKTSSVRIWFSVIKICPTWEQAQTHTWWRSQGIYTRFNQDDSLLSFISPHKHRNGQISEHDNTWHWDTCVDFKPNSPSCHTLPLANASASIMSVWEALIWLVVSKILVQKCSKGDKNSLQAICAHLGNGMEHHFESKVDTHTQAFQKSIHVPGKNTVMPCLKPVGQMLMTNVFKWMEKHRKSRCLSLSALSNTYW